MTLSTPAAAGKGTAAPAVAGLSVAFTVYGTPAPQGSKRHVGKGVMVESSAKVKPWRQAVKWAALDALNDVAPFDGPLDITIVFCLPRPVSAPKRVTLPAKRPDLDKLLRSTLDGIGESGLWLDDSQVVSLQAHKVFAGGFDMLAPGARVLVQQIKASA